MTIAQGGTLLPDRDYYVKDDERFIRIRAQYVDYLSSIFTLARRPNAAADARAVLALETAIARLQWTGGASARSVEHREEVLARGARA